MFSNVDFGEFFKAFIDTIYMSFVSTIFVFILGLILGILLFTTNINGITPNKKVNQIIIDKALEGEMVTPQEQGDMVADEATQIQTALQELGNQRFIKPSEIDDKTWKETIEGIAKQL